MYIIIYLISVFISYLLLRNGMRNDGVYNTWSAVTAKLILSIIPVCNIIMGLMIFISSLENIKKKIEPPNWL